MPEELMIKTYEAETKEVEGERAFEVTITTTAVDRDGDIVEAKGAKLTNYRKNPVVLMAHDYRGLPIAKAENLIRTDDDIKAKVIFPPEGDYPLADIVHRLYKGKFMRAWSIGFIPIKTEDIVDEDDKDKGGERCGRGRRIKSWELLEFSACAVPSNPEALNNMMEKGINIDTLKEAGFIEIEDIEELNSDNEKIEETEDSIRIPAKGEEGKHKGHKIRWITVSEKEGIRGIYCIDCKKIITFVFDKKKGWTLEKAKKWMSDHGKNISGYYEGMEKATLENIEKEEMTVKDIEDEIKNIAEAGEEIKGEVLETTFTEVKEFSANEIYEIVKENKELKEKVDKLEKEKEEIELKAGAVLNKRNKQDLKDAQAKIQNVLDSAEPAEEDSLEIEEEKDSKDDDTVIDLENNTVDDPVIDEEKDKDAIEVDEKVIAKAINEKMSYILGKVKK